MDKPREEEFLMHIAAGTDPLTAFAALPREEKSSDELPPVASHLLSAIGWATLACIAFAVWWLL
jgi:hypothetical protein